MRDTTKPARGRRAASPEKKRDDRLYVLLTTAERERLDAAAATARKPASAWARELLLAAAERASPCPREPPRPLPEFAARVLEAARSTKTGRFSDDSIFIAHVWRRFCELHPGAVETDEAAFKTRLVEANRCQLVRLARADLVEVMDPQDVAASETRHFAARFHFVRL